MKSIYEKKLINIFIINALIVFIYAVLFSSLTTYLNVALNFNAIESENIVGLFLALNFILHLVAGYMGERFFSNRQILFLSCVLQFFGTIYLFSVVKRDDIYLGLAMTAIGCGLNTTSLQSILTSKFEQGDFGREKAFFWMYSALNIGFFVGLTVAGCYVFNKYFNNLYALVSFVVMVSIFWISLSWRSLAGICDKSISFLKSLIGYMIVFCLIPICELAFVYPKISNDIILLVSAAALLSILILAERESNLDFRNGLIAFFLLTFFSIVFWALFYIGPLGGIIFLTNNVNLRIFGYAVAPQWLMNLNSVFVILGAPFVANAIELLKKRCFNITIPKKFLSALILIALSYFVYSIGIHFCNNAGKTSIVWVTLHYALQASGELLIAPVGYAMIGKIIQTKHQSYVMGIWMMTGGIAVEISNILSHYMILPAGANQLQINEQYMSIFNSLGISTFILALVFLIMLRFLERLVSPS